MKQQLLLGLCMVILLNNALVNGLVVHTVSLVDSVPNYTNGNLSVTYIADSNANFTDWRLNDVSITSVNLPFNSNHSNNISNITVGYSTQRVDGFVGLNRSNGRYISSLQPLWTTTNCKIGGCYVFDGINDSIQLNNTPMITSVLPTGTAKASINVWANFTGLGSRTIVEFTGTISIYGGASQTVTVAASNGISGVTGNNAFTNNNWSMFTLVYDGSAVNITNPSGNANTERLKLYVNGEQKNLTFTGTIPSTLTVASASYVGAYATAATNATSNPMNGSVDELLLFTRVLSQGEIRYIFTQQNQSKSIDKIFSNQLNLSNRWTTLVGTCNSINCSTNISNQVWINNGYLVAYPCQTLTTENRSYLMNQTINSNGMSCFNITAKNITLNGGYASNGFVLNGSNLTNSHTVWMNGNYNTLNNLYSNNSYYNLIINGTSNTIINNSYFFARIQLNSTAILANNTINLTIMNSVVSGQGNNGQLSAGLRLYKGNMTYIEGLTSNAGVLFFNTTNTIMKRSLNTVAGIQIFNSTQANFLFIDSNSTSAVVTTVGIQFTQSNNLTILNSILRCTASGTTPLKIVLGTNVYADNTSFDGNSVNALLFTSGSNVTINRSLLFTSSSSFDVVSTTAGSSNLLIENSEIRTGPASGGSGLALSGENSTFKNINFTTNAYMLAGTSTAKNILINNVTQTLTTSSNNIGGGISWAGNNLTATNIKLNYTLIQNTTFFNFAPLGKNVNIIGVRAYSPLNNIHPVGVRFFSGVQNVTLSYVNMSMGGYVLGNNITNVTRFSLNYCNFTGNSSRTLMITNGTTMNITGSYINNYVFRQVRNMSFFETHATVWGKW